MSLFYFPPPPPTNTYIYIIPETLFLSLEYVSLPRSLSGNFFLLSWWCNHSKPASQVLSHFCSTVSSIVLLNSNFLKPYALLWKFGSAFPFWIVDFLVSLMVWIVLSSRSKINEADFHWDKDSELFHYELVYGPTLQRCTYILIVHFKNLIGFNGANQNT